MGRRRGTCRRQVIPVTHVLQARDSGRFACRIVFGTTNLKVDQRRHLDLIIEEADHLSAIGLARATPFDLDSVAILPWNSRFFGCWSGYPTPILGPLIENDVKEYAYLMMKRRSV